MILTGVLAVVSMGGLITTVVFGAAADQYSSYGEVPIPGAGEVRLPEGEAIVSFHVGDYGGAACGCPTELRHHRTARESRSDRDRGSRGHCRGQRRRSPPGLVPAGATEGTYRIIHKGEVNGFVEPRLAFGRTRSLEAPLWMFAVLSMVSVDLFIAVWWFSRRRRDPRRRATRHRRSLCSER